MHRMEGTPKLLTTVGLVIEFLAFILFIVLTIVANIVAAIPKADLIARNWSEYDADIFLQTTSVFSNVFLAISILIGVMLIVNLVLFIGLMKGRFSGKKVKAIYVYQAIWGAISLTFNTITGVLYLISAVQTHTKYYPGENHKNRRGKKEHGVE